MNYFYEFVYKLFAGKSFNEQMIMIGKLAIAVFVLDIVLTWLVKWIRKKLK